MACTQTLAGISRDCLNSVGGIKKVWIANAADIDVVNLVEDGIVSGFDMKTGKKFYAYDFTRGTSSLTSNYQVNAENGTRYVQSDLVLVFCRMNTAKRMEILSLKSSELVIVVEDNNGKKWVLGVMEGGPNIPNPVVGADADADGLTGTAYGDRNGYSITFHWNSAELPWESWSTPPTA